MDIDIPEGHNVIAGKAQGYKSLPMRVEVIRCALTDGRQFDSSSMLTRWAPTEDEIVRILAGEHVFVRILGDTPPPMDVGVGDPRKYGW